jgi:sRNA-binding regulator protein Hfq
MGFMDRVTEHQYQQGQQPGTPVRIYDPYIPPPVKKQPDFLRKLLGKDVKILMSNEDEIYGTITGYNRYEIVMALKESEIADAIPVLIMKHAIDLIIPEDETVFDKKTPEPAVLPKETEAGKRMTD